MSEFFARILAVILAVLAFFGIKINGSNTPPANPEVPTNSIEIALPANATTGYEWVCSIEGDSVKYVSSNYVPDKYPGDIPVVGAGGMTYFYFEPTKVGKSTITFTYLRTFDSSATTQTRVCEVNVTDDSGELGALYKFIYE